MVEVGIYQIPTSTFDPFAEAKETDAPGAKEYVHIRIQQRNGKKSLTTVQGLKKEFSYEKILKDLKKEFCMTRSLARLSNSRVISARTFLTSSFMLALLGRTRSRFMVFNPLPLATTFLLL